MRHHLTRRVRRPPVGIVVAGAIWLSAPIGHDARTAHAQPASAQLASAQSASAQPASDVATLTALNDDYVQAVKTSNARRFEEILGDDFLCTLGDGRLIDRRQFLTEVAQPSKAANLQVHDVNVRVLGDFAIVHARTTYTSAEGKPGESRYTDVWARRNGRWVAIAAQITRAGGGERK